MNNEQGQATIRRIIGWVYVTPGGSAMLLSPAEAEARYGASLYRNNKRPEGVSPIFEGDEMASKPIFKSRPFARLEPVVNSLSDGSSCPA